MGTDKDKPQATLQSGNYMDGYKDLPPLERVRFLQPQLSPYAEIEIYINDAGNLTIYSTHGGIIVKPRVSNVIEVHTERLGGE